MELAVVQYFGAANWDRMLNSFSYDDSIAKLESDGLTNLAASWAHAGKNLENGGTDKHGGSGGGVKVPFVYAGLNYTSTLNTAC